MDLASDVMKWNDHLEYDVHLKRITFFIIKSLCTVNIFCLFLSSPSHSAKLDQLQNQF